MTTDPRQASAWLLKPRSEATPEAWSVSAGSRVYVPASVIPVAPHTVAGDSHSCHLHTKPLLSCKFCRKFKMAVHHQARIAQLQRWTDCKQNALEMTNTTTYNLNALLRENILASEYFKSLYAYETVQDIIAEIAEYVDHAEPYCVGYVRAPSTFICCLYKLFTMKLTEEELLTIIEDDRIFVRAIGYLWLRFVHPPEKIWPWFESVLLDDELFVPSADNSPQNEITFGEFVQSLLTEDRYFQTVLPRLPAKIRAQYGVQLVTLAEHRRRKRRNKMQIWKFKKGSDVMACYKCDWRYGVFTGFYEDDVTGARSAMVKFNDDDVECAEEDAVPIDLGLVIVLSRKHKRRKIDAGHSWVPPSEPPTSMDPAEQAKPLLSDSNEDILFEYRKMEREKALANGKDYAKRPSSYKASLSSKLNNET